MCGVCIGTLRRSAFIMLKIIYRDTHVFDKRGNRKLEVMGLDLSGLRLTRT
jgi:hypothetical protein